MLTDEETRVAAYAFALHLDDKGFVPTDSYLPECERLRERGWLARRDRWWRTRLRPDAGRTLGMELHRLGNPDDVSAN
jgi:hypothetical protein